MTPRCHGGIIFGGKREGVGVVEYIMVTDIITQKLKYLQ